MAQMPPESESAAARATICREMLGFVPPCQAGGESDTLGPLLHAMQEQMRVGGLIPERLDAKAAHLTLLAMLLMDHGAGACAQAVAARRAGASWDDLRDVVHLAILLHGLTVVRRGEELLNAVVEWEHNDRIAGAMAAYG